MLLTRSTMMGSFKYTGLSIYFNKILYSNLFFLQKTNLIFILYLIIFWSLISHYWGLGIGDWGLGIGDWGLGQSPIPNPQSPIPKNFYFKIFKFRNFKNINMIVNRIN
jgi:hypothetical protein